MLKVIRKLTCYFLLSLLIGIHISCAGPFRFINFDLWNTPRYSKTVNPPYKGLFKDKIKIVSYNIKHSARINQAVKLLRENDSLKDADILLLQEMVPKAVEQIAEELDYNYIFYPSVIHPVLDANFGNAILSKWPITYDHNIIFPNKKKNRRHRTAVAAKIVINGNNVLVCSLHMGIFMKPSQRSAQIKNILNAIPGDIKYCIIGGDFNTIREKDHKEIIKTFKEAGFEYATSDVDWTYNHWYFMNYKSIFDHLFIRGPEKIASGKVNNRTASDHLPVWVEVEIK